MEEWVGQVWHKYITKKASHRHEEAAVWLDDIKTQLPILFRAFGGDPAIEIKKSVAKDWQGKRSWLSRLASSQQQIEMASLNQTHLALPESIAIFADKTLNQQTYLWLVAMLASPTAEFKEDDWLANNLRQIEITLKTLPGLKKIYRRLAKAYADERASYIDSDANSTNNDNEKILRQLLRGESFDSVPRIDPRQLQPVAIWPDPFPPETPVITPSQTANSSENKQHAENTQQKKIDLHKEGESVEDVDGRSGLMAFRLESLFSWAEFIPVDRTADEDELDDAADAAKNIDKIAVSRDDQTQSGRLKFDLDLPAAEFDDTTIEAGIPIAEWDYRQQTLLKDRCRLHRMRPKHLENHKIPFELRQKAKRIKAQFEILATNKQWLRGQPDGTELDLDKIILQQADRMRGHATLDENNYLELRQNIRSLSCLLLADLSLSTDSFVNDKARVIDIIRDSLFLFSESLSVTQDRYAIAGFNSKRHDGVRYYEIKNFEERQTSETYDWIQGLKPNCYTRMGPAIRHAVANLEKEPSETKLLLILSDGKPNDLDIYEGRYGIEDTRHAVREAARAGVRVFCVTIDDDDNDYLSYIFGCNQYVKVRNAVELPEKLPRLYHYLTH